MKLLSWATFVSVESFDLIFVENINDFQKEGGFNLLLDKKLGFFFKKKEN